MATPAPVSHRAAEETHDRAQPPLRWPHFDALDFGLILLWAASLVVGLVLPTRLVDPMTSTAPAGHVSLVFLVAAACVVVMVGSTALVARRTKQTGVMLLGAVPGTVVLLFSILITIAKIQNG